MTAGVGCKFTVHFSTSFSTTRTRSDKTELCSLADIATLGFAISLMTSASVALAGCFFVFLLPIPHDFTRPGASTGQFGSLSPAKVLLEAESDTDS